MSNKIFRSIITTAALVLLASFVIIIGVLIRYFTQVMKNNCVKNSILPQRQLKNRGRIYKRLHTGAVTVADGSIRPDGGQHSTHADIKHGGSYL